MWVGQRVTSERERGKKRWTGDTNKQLTYNLIRRRAASHPALQFALGVFDGVLRAVRCDDGGAWWSESITVNNSKVRKWGQTAKQELLILTLLI